MGLYHNLTSSQNLPLSISVPLAKSRVKRSAAPQPEPQGTLSARDAALIRIQARVRARGTTVADILAAIARIRARNNRRGFGTVADAEIDRAIEETVDEGDNAVSDGDGDDDSISFYEDFGPDPDNEGGIEPRGPGARTPLQIEGDRAFERIKARVEARLRGMESLSTKVRHGKLLLHLMITGVFLQALANTNRLDAGRGIVRVASDQRKNDNTSPVTVILQTPANTTPATTPDTGENTGVSFSDTLPGGVEGPLIASTLGTNVQTIKIDRDHVAVVIVNPSPGFTGTMAVSPGAQLPPPQGGIDTLIPSVINTAVSAAVPAVSIPGSVPRVAPTSTGTNSLVPGVTQVGNSILSSIKPLIVQTAVQSVASGVISGLIGSILG